MKKIFVSTILTLCALSNCFGTESSSSSTAPLASAHQEAALSWAQYRAMGINAITTPRKVSIDGKVIYDLDFDKLCRVTISSPHLSEKERQIIKALQAANKPEEFSPAWKMFCKDKVTFTENAVETLGLEEAAPTYIYKEKIDKLKAQASPLIDSCIIYKTVCDLIDNNDRAMQTAVKWMIVSYYYCFSNMREENPAAQLTTFFSQGSNGHSECINSKILDVDNWLLGVNIDIPEWTSYYAFSPKYRSYVINHEFGHLIYFYLDLYNYLVQDLDKIPFIRKIFPLYAPERVMQDCIETFQIIGFGIFQDGSILSNSFADWAYVFQGEYPASCLKPHTIMLFYRDLATRLCANPTFLRIKEKGNLSLPVLEMTTSQENSNFFKIKDTDEAFAMLETLHGKYKIQSTWQFITGGIEVTPYIISFMLGDASFVNAMLRGANLLDFANLSIGELVIMFYQSGAYYKFGLDQEAESFSWEIAFSKCKSFFNEQISRYWNTNSSTECLFANGIEDTNKACEVLSTISDFEVLYRQVASKEIPLKLAIKIIQHDYEEVSSLIPKQFSGMHSILYKHFEVRKKVLESILSFREAAEILASLAQSKKITEDEEDEFATPPSAKKIKM